MSDIQTHFHATDALGFLALRSIQEQEERMRAQAFEQLIIKLQKKPLTIGETREVTDILGEFIKKIDLYKQERKAILDIFRQDSSTTISNKTIEPKVQPSRRYDSQKNQITHNNNQQSKTINGIITDLRGMIDGDILSRFPTAYKNYMSMSQDLRDSIYRLSGVFGIGHTQVLGLIANESHFRYDVVSRVGASGPMQFMPDTRNGLRKFLHSGSIKNSGAEERFFAVLRQNSDFMKIYNSSEKHKDLALGIAYLGYLTQRYGKEALRIYNGGINYPNNHENMDYTRRVKEFQEAFGYILKEKKIMLASK